ncbi:MAG: malate/lactate/ureidoglycolate dehydrogenase [Zymomonas mobilis subsp. pomaceae]|uniref:malate/lactate/ureidoglycolate dehydrogenase n=1 Tax=Zymomonas mobilis TaxID=542 RepID=UPI0039E8E3B0
MPIFKEFYLKEYLKSLLIKYNTTEDIAQDVAENLVESSFKGHDSHGVTILPNYIAAIQEGGLNPTAEAKKIVDHGALISFDGQQGFGQFVAKQALQQGIKRAQNYGVAIIGLANAHHLGRIGAWAEKATQANLIAIHFVNVNRCAVAPWQGQSARLGTNPFCVGIPLASKAPIILDFATSKIARNKARIAWEQGLPLKEGCAVDSEGKPTVDPRWLMQSPLGALLPFGEHKGSGLSIICSILGAALTGGQTERHADKGVKTTINNMLSILIDPQFLAGADSHQQEITDLLDWVRHSSEDNTLLLPGEAEQRLYQDRKTNGLFIEDAHWEAITNL